MVYKIKEKALAQWNDEMRTKLDPHSSDYEINFSKGVNFIDNRAELLRAIRNVNEFDTDDHGIGNVFVNGQEYHWEIWYYHPSVNNEPLETLDYQICEPTTNCYRVIHINTKEEYEA